MIKSRLLQNNFFEQFIKDNIFDEAGYLQKVTSFGFEGFTDSSSDLKSDRDAVPRRLSIFKKEITLLGILIHTIKFNTLSDTYRNRKHTHHKLSDFNARNGDDFLIKNNCVNQLELLQRVQNEIVAHANLLDSREKNKSDLLEYLSFDQALQYIEKGGWIHALPSRVHDSHSIAIKIDSQVYGLITNKIRIDLYVAGFIHNKKGELIYVATERFCELLITKKKKDLQEKISLL